MVRHVLRPPARPVSPVLSALGARRSDAVAVVDAVHHSNSRLVSRAAALARLLPSAPVAVFLPPDASFVVSLLAAWGASAVPVPLSPLYPAAALAPLIDAVQPQTVLTSSALRHALPPTPYPVTVLDDLVAPDIDNYVSTCQTLARKSLDDAIIFFTSGTTGVPRGVVWTQSMLRYQLETLSRAWHWSSDDHILNVLPLHHIHGLVNVVLSAIFTGSRLTMHSAFDAHSVWRAFLSDDPPTVFMAVPSIYHKLVRYYKAASSREQRAMRRAAHGLRLFVCGSAGLPRSDFDAWSEISGQPILERYGMTETGMTLSNPYERERRQPGLLGLPLDGVETKIVEGELRVRGPGVFSRYWRMPEATQKSFVDGWFATGDVVDVDERTGYYRLLGRASADIIKTGGYKVSALEIEEVLRQCPGVMDCCVVGTSDNALGERITAAVVLDGDHDVLSRLQLYAEEMLPKYKVPREYHILDDFPRNILGKAQKSVLKLKLGL